MNRGINVEKNDMNDYRELGGYIEFERSYGFVYHDEALHLNCGRNALAYLCESRSINSIRLPSFICSSVPDLCKRIGVTYSFYSIKENFEPDDLEPLNDNEWLYLVNFYGQIKNSTIEKYILDYKRVIVDNAQSYFQKPVYYGSPENLADFYPVDTFYTCRKYFGVSDGAFLYTSSRINRKLSKDESYKRMNFLLGRLDTESARKFYEEYKANNKLFENEPVKEMSRLTENILKSIDYKWIKKTRNDNFRYLHQKLKGINELKLDCADATFMYPLLIKNGSVVRRELIKRGLYVPQLWPFVLENSSVGSLDFYYASNIIPLCIDQRYDLEDMEYIAGMVNDVICSTGC